MEIPIIIENHGFHYRVWSRYPTFVEATAPTSPEARRLVEERLRDLIGHEVETIPIQPDSDHPLFGSAGWLPDDELTDQWLAAVEEYRRQCDQPEAGAMPPVPEVPAGPLVGVRP